jgi:hypothetical protein
MVRIIENSEDDDGACVVMMRASSNMPQPKEPQRF